MRFVRYPHILALALASGVCSACFVPQAHYDELSQQHTLEKQKNARLSQQLEELGKQLTETRATLEKVEARLSGSQQELAHKQATLESNTQNLAEAEYESSVKENEKQAAEGMVAQLRAELTRIAGHIATLSAAKDQLQTERDKLASEVVTLSARVKTLESEQAQSRQRAELVRDLTLKLAEPLQAEKLRLGIEPGGVDLKCSAAAIFDAKSGAVSNDGRKLLSQVGKALAGSSLQVQISELAPERSVAQREAHIRQVAGELHSAGLALEQLTMRDDPSKPAQGKDKKSESIVVLRVRTKAAANAPAG